MNNYTYTYACRNIVNTIKASGHSSLEKYTSHFIEKVVCEREVETEQRLQHIYPPASPAITAFLSRSPGCSTGGLGAQPLLGHGSHSSIFTRTDLNSNCCRGYIIIWHPPTSCERHNSHSIQPFDSQGCPLISSTGCTCYLHRWIFSFDCLAGVNMLPCFPKLFATRRIG